MRILDRDNDIAVKHVEILLTSAEALELMDALQDLLSNDEGQLHSHINDSSYQHELTLAIYNDNNKGIDIFNARIKELIEHDK